MLFIYTSLYLYRLYLIYVHDLINSLQKNTVEWKYCLQ
jgi:hypothetical protein